MTWRMSHRFDTPARLLADRHYNRQKPGSPQFMPPGSCRVLLSENKKAVFGLSFPKAEFVKHAWAGAWVCSIFRNEESGPLASDLVRDAIAIMQTLYAVPSLGCITFVDPKKVPGILVRGERGEGVRAMTHPAPARKPLPLSIKLAVALRVLQVTESDIDWSHEPALGLRAINDKGTDYVPPQHDPAYIFIRPRADHDRITFKDNGTGRGDLTAIAHVKRVRRREAHHLAALAAKFIGQEKPEPERRTRKIASRGFGKGQRPLRGRNDLSKKNRGHR